jgi:hypothetical protein
MSEFEEAIVLAERILDTPNKDPDDSESMLARQFLRSVERERRGDPTADLIHSNRDAMLEKHEQAVSRVRCCLTEGLADKSGMRYRLERECKTAMAVLDALSLFHPMHCESWKGWPE